ncbi:hypothetical protein HNQ04_003547 [Deinococcus radiopugnans ATCC 19172]|uniref:Uncharacterized protein n=1 Tax=Deinococcus radiopugnans ATCC 19172 TaxID=585398 RepID=A0ABR6NW49_9DEIO|nr:hypothetical protein [Deinococcus radiopugnans ATCC 19172]
MNDLVLVVEVVEFVAEMLLDSAVPLDPLSVV